LDGKAIFGRRMLNFTLELLLVRCRALSAS